MQINLGESRGQMRDEAAQPITCHPAGPLQAEHAVASEEPRGSKTPPQQERPGRKGERGHARGTRLDLPQDRGGLERHARGT